MRVKLGKRIFDECTVATCNRRLILLTIRNEVYTVDMVEDVKASVCHKYLLVNGYYDFSGYDYSN